MTKTPDIEILASEDFELKIKKPKILLLDIECSPTQVTTWKKYQADAIWTVSDWYLLSFSAKWLHGKQITKGLISYEGYEDNRSSDRKLCEELHSLINDADLIVGHNVQRFDLPKIYTRFIKHDLPPVPKKQLIDTLRISKRVFGQGMFSHKLDDLGQFLDIGKKVSTGGWALWRGCMDGDAKAWKQLLKYNAQDVKLTEELYLKLRGWDTLHPNLNLYMRTDEQCPKCGGTNLVRRGYSYSSIGRASRWQCKTCYGYSQGAYRKQVDIR